MSANHSKYIENPKGSARYRNDGTLALREITRLIKRS